MPNLSEAEFTTKFGWNYKTYLNKPCLIEIKICNNTFNLKAWKTGKQSHQYANLMEAYKTGYYWKIPDENKSTQRPADGFFVDDGVLIIWFNKHQLFAIIPVSEIASYGDSVAFKDIPKKYIKKLLPKPIKEVVEF